MQKHKPIHFKTLDSLRFISFAIVFSSHLFYDIIDSIGWLYYIKPIFGSGEQGVRIFFVLSGFLITFLLFKEKSVNQNISIKNFYIRRTLRIWPLYYLIIILGLLILPNISSVFQFCGSYFLNFTFLNNFNFDEIGKCFSPHVQITWSVAIEEQFYIVWPILFIISSKYRFLPILCITGFISSYIYSVFYGYNYFSTICNINYLLVGCLGGYIYYHNRNLLTNSFLKSKLFLTTIIAFLFLTTIIFYNYDGGKDHYIFIKEIIFPIIYILIIFYCVINDSLSKN